MSLLRGTVVEVVLGPTVGHEQSGVRPCVVVSEPKVSSVQRFPLVCVVPFTTTPGVGDLYPQVGPGTSGLRHRSWAMIDHVRSVDKRRVRRAYGQVSREEAEAIDTGLLLYLGLAPSEEDDEEAP